MAFTKAWTDGSGDKVTIEYAGSSGFSGTGNGDASLVLTSDQNTTDADRSMGLSVRTADGKVTHSLVLSQPHHEVQKVAENICLCHFEAMTSGTWTDSSGKGCSIVSGHSSYVARSSTQKKFGSYSVRFAGGNRAYPVNVTLPAEYATLTEYTIQCWVWRQQALANNYYYTLFSTSGSTNGGTQFNISNGKKGACTFAVPSSGSTSVTMSTGTTTFATSRWYHVAYCRKGDKHYFFVDGVLQGTITQASPNQIRYLMIGERSTSMTNNSSNSGTNYRLAGSSTSNYAYVDEFVVTDACLWTANFTPPTSAY